MTEMAGPETAKRTAFENFVGIIDRLRSPGGCPWDLEQTHMSLRQATIEEAYEVVHAIESGDPANLKEELGDILLHVVFHSDIAKRAGTFTIDDVVAAVSEKMVRRHPHVFGSVEVADAETVIRNWEELKRKERAEKGAAEPASILDAVHQNVPALMEAQALSLKAARVGFDWKTAAEVRGKIDEEFAEIEGVLSEAASNQAVIPPNEEGTTEARRPNVIPGTTQAVAPNVIPGTTQAERPNVIPAKAGNHVNTSRLEEEFGDLLFAVINYGRKLGVDAETALRSVNRKFRRRFAAVEAGLRSQGRTPKDATLDDMEALWQAAKTGD